MYGAGFPLFIDQCLMFLSWGSWEYKCVIYKVHVRKITKFEKKLSLTSNNYKGKSVRAILI